MPRLASAFAVLLCLAAPVAGAEALHAFTESGGCRVLGSATSTARQKEIAASGSVTWDGKCVDGLIEGPGVLRHQGTTMENGRQRRFAFFLTGVARAGKRIGAWRRESFNMYADSPRYWVSLATLDYVDGVARGEARFLKFASHAELGQPFQQFLAGVDRDIAAAKVGATVAVAAPAAKEVPPPQASAVPPPTPTPSAAETTPPVARPAPAPPPAAAPTPGLPATAAPAPPAAPATPGPVAAAAAPPGSASPPGGAADAKPAPGAGRSLPSPARDRAFAVLVPAGRAMPAPAPPASPQQQILEQRHACALERINDIRIDVETMRLPASLEITVSGWASDPVGLLGREEPRVPTEAWLRLYARSGGPGLLLPLPRNVERPDVARALGHAAHSRSGFRVAIEPGRLRPGEYSVAILQRFDADIAVCQSTARLLLE